MGGCKKECLNLTKVKNNEKYEKDYFAGGMSFCRFCDGGRVGGRCKKNLAGRENAGNGMQGKGNV